MPRGQGKCLAFQNILFPNEIKVHCHHFWSNFKQNT